MIERLDVVTDSVLDTLKKRLSASGWTPGKKDVSTLIEHWLDFSPQEREALEKVIAKMDQLAVGRSLNLWSSVNVRVKGDWARPLARAILKNQQDDAVDWLAQNIISETDPRTRKGFIQAVGAGLQTKDKEIKFKKKLVDAVLEVAERVDLQLPEIKALSETLGKSADPRAVVVLKSLAKRGGNTTRSELILERDSARSIESSNVKIDLAKLMDLSDGVAKKIVLWFVPGIETLAMRSSAFAAAEKLGAGVILVESASGQAIRMNQLWLEIGVVLGEINTDDVAALAQVVARSEARLRASMTGLEADGKIRLRFDQRSDDQADKKETRASSSKHIGPWAFAEALNREGCGVISDGRDSHWQLRLIKHDRKTLVAVVPKKFEDQRWQWRTDASKEVEGSSQSTIAAAIVALAAPRAGETIWDPFCGAGTELVIASQMTAGKAKLLGTDINPEAIKVAQETAKRLGANMDLRQSDALTMTEKFSIVLTNPPFGMRTARGEARGILESFFGKIRMRLVSGGRFVLLSNAPAGTAQWGKTAGLKLVESIPVRLGGMSCELQRFE